ncbi:hypothetical protein ACQP2P_26695 [Dactylosporangium sp. CA-139114]|uniref:hypothetical protein n=1 Tax=Dactylosporangium sp. CA-139114 TaxID=3239931 RepID=UPI003D967869
MAEVQRWWRLRWRVVQACGPAEKFAAIESRFAGWLDEGRHATPAVIDDVEPYLARYLHDAGSAGRRWGRTLGFVGGSVVGVLAGLLLAVFT